MRKIIVCDLDGTLSDCKHRQHLAAAGDWDGFHALMHKDPPVAAVLNFLDSAYDILDWRVIFLTGRPEAFRSVTVKWLDEICGFGPERYIDLLMRPKDDWDSDIIVKPRLLYESLNEGVLGPLTEGYDKERLLFLEDRDRVTAMWRDLGYTCWQVAEGAF